jgi:hypothetical protein
MTRTLAVVATGLSFSVGAVGSTAGAQEPPASAAQPQEQFCFWRAEDQPNSPLELNLVASGRLAKTIAIQKGDLRLRPPVDAVARQIGAIDVETFVELVRRAGRRGIKTVARRVRVAACRKQIVPLGEPPIRIACETRVVKLRKLPTPFNGCAFTGLPRDPVVVDSVRLRYRSNSSSRRSSSRTRSSPAPTGSSTSSCSPRSWSPMKGDVVPVATTFDAIAFAKAQTTRGEIPAVRCAPVPT